MKESLDGRLNNWASVASTKAVAEPKSAISHIQKIAPGPPTAMAVATPAKLPVPTRVAIDTAKAWNEDMCLPLLLDDESTSWRNISPIIVNCTKRERIVKYKPHKIKAPISR